MPDMFVAISRLSRTPKASQLPSFPSSSLFLFLFLQLFLSHINVTLTFLFCCCFVFKLLSSLTLHFLQQFSS